MLSLSPFPFHSIYKIHKCQLLAKSGWRLPSFPLISSFSAIVDDDLYNFRYNEQNLATFFCFSSFHRFNTMEEFQLIYVNRKKMEISIFLIKSINTSFAKICQTQQKFCTTQMFDVMLLGKKKSIYPKEIRVDFIFDE